ncbi:ocs element-binding factor 1 [Carex littledalei]|uniref:Ocs element-binding factor 1 n=1 Tax=Carex littledalei TaxID=544730 RepID=A0A833RXT2_9POAL|nr:ocs element-binding factor 1 [Carex littledalei]
MSTDEHKRKRMISNRESARRSRKKKQERLEELISEAARLKSENAQVEMHANLLMERYSKVEMENEVLRAEMVQLAERLKSANMYLSLFEVVSGVDMDIEEIPDPFLRPWLPVCTSQINQCNC